MQNLIAIQETYFNTLNLLGTHEVQHVVSKRISVVFKTYETLRQRNFNQKSMGHHAHNGAGLLLDFHSMETIIPGDTNAICSQLTSSPPAYQQNENFNLIELRT